MVKMGLTRVTKWRLLTLREGKQLSFDNTLRDLVSGLRDIYSDRLVSIILYGSTVRNTV